MVDLTTEEIIKAVDGEIYKGGKISKFTGICTDTRKIERDNIFIALKGDNFDGNDFVGTALEKGAALCIVDEIKFDRKNVPEGRWIITVQDTKSALLNLAKYYKSKLNIKVIAVTGSTGKTTTKDLTCAVLSSKFKVFKTQGNFNNEIGLPLTIFKLDNSFDVAILEMGMSHFGEIHKLSDVAKPDIAIMTNIGISHIENLKTRENILKAKLEITDFFKKNNYLIINADNDLLSTINTQKFTVVKTGGSDEFDFSAKDIQLSEDSIKFSVCEKGIKRYENFDIDIPGLHNVSNALLAIACGRILGMDYKDIKSGIKNLKPTSMRLDIIKGNKFTIIDDSYNASPDSMKAALDVMANIDAKRKVAVFGTMRELGDKSYEAHKKVGKYAKDLGVTCLIAVGEYRDAYKEGYGESDKCCIMEFKDTCEVIEHIKEIVKSGDIILVKASRAMKFENIVSTLKHLNS